MAEPIYILANKDKTYTTGLFPTADSAAMFHCMYLRNLDLAPTELLVCSTVVECLNDSEVWTFDERKLDKEACVAQPKHLH